MSGLYSNLMRQLVLLRWLALAGQCLAVLVTTYGLGIALLPDFFAGPEVRLGSLVPVLPEWKPERRRIFCAYQRQRYAAKKLQAFIALLSECMTDLEALNTYVAIAPR